MDIFYCLTSATNSISCLFACPAADDCTDQRQQHQSNRCTCSTQESHGGGRRGSWGGGGGGATKSNQDRVFELEGEARTNRFSAFSADVNSTCWGLRSWLLRELLGVLLQQDHAQAGSALPLCVWRETWLHFREKKKRERLQGSILTNNCEDN